MGPFILDLYCAGERLAIEVDGGGHAQEGQAVADESRTRFLAERGVRVFRFWNHEVLRELEAVLDRISEELGLG